MQVHASSQIGHSGSLLFPPPVKDARTECCGPLYSPMAPFLAHTFIFHPASFVGQSQWGGGVVGWWEGICWSKSERQKCVTNDPSESHAWFSTNTKSRCCLNNFYCQGLCLGPTHLFSQGCNSDRNVTNAQCMEWYFTQVKVALTCLWSWFGHFRLPNVFLDSVGTFGCTRGLLSSSFF